MTAPLPDPEKHALVIFEACEFNHIAALALARQNYAANPSKDHPTYWLSVVQALERMDPEPDWIATPQSSNIARWRYVPGERLLYVAFRRKDAPELVYRYEGVDSGTVARLAAAESVGRTFAAEIRTAFKYSRLGGSGGAS